MFQHLLVPLDGSRLAEAALIPAASLAQQLGSSVTLIHVIEKNPPTTIHGDSHLSGDDEACQYLGKLAKERFPTSAVIESHVHTEEVRDVARSIASHTSEFGSDLIVMCTHGQGGLRDLLVGSIAQQLIGMGKTPVLLVQPDEDGRLLPINFTRLLVGLDTDPEHERSLSIAIEFAKLIHANLHLVTVVQTSQSLKGQSAAAGRMLPGTTSLMLNMAEDVARQYLKDKSAALQQQGLTVTYEVRRGDPAEKLVEAARKAQVDLIVLGTHGKSGMDAFWSGSVAPRIPNITRIPLLLIPV